MLKSGTRHLACLWTALALLSLGVVAQPALAGTIILEGSDAIGFHSTDNTAAGAYRDQVWSAIGGADARPIAVVGGSVSAGTIISNTHAITRLTDLTGATLGDYAAIYFLAATGCCTEDTSLPAGHEAAISAYLGAGGTIMIENYTGASAWDFAVGSSGGAANAHVQGVGGGHSSGLICDDGETVTTDGITNGFTQPTPMSCWTHQAYDMAYFAPLGFTLSFFDSPPIASSSSLPGEGPWSSLLSSGKTITGGGGGTSVPEPGTLMLLSIAMLGLGLALRQRG